MSLLFSGIQARNPRGFGATPRIALSALLGLAVISAAQADWTVTYLKPAGSTSSSAYGTSATQQAGSANFGGRPRAGLWSGNAAAWINLNPTGSSSSQAYATSGTEQVGYAYPATGIHASLWRGSAASWVDLNPAGAHESYAYGVSGTQQVGYANFGMQSAGIWSGSAASWVFLGDYGKGSGAYATSGTQQVGYVILPGGEPGPFHASLWNTGGGRVDLNPAGASHSFAYGICGTQQVGEAGYHGGFWTGTAASWVDLNPPGAAQSEARGTSGTQQVGWASIGGVHRASLWSGTAASWEDLSAALMGSWGATEARSIWTDGATIYVAGYGRNNATGYDEALLWTRPVPEPATLSLLALVGLFVMRRRR